MFLIRFSINNPLMMNMLLAIIIIMGTLSWFALPQEMFPVVQQDKVRINTLFEGASPDEVEQQVTLPIEEEFDAVADIEVITSVSSESNSSILIELKQGTNVDDFLNDARERLDRIVDLPELAEKPELIRLQTRFPVISLTLYGDVSRAYLYELAENTKRDMLQIKGVASVGTAGDREWELWVIVDPNELAARDVPLAQVIRALRENLRDVPGGSIRASEGDILLRGKGSTPSPEGLASISVRSNAEGGQLLLGSIAKIERRLEEVRTIGRFNGKPSVNLTVTKTADASTIEVSDLVREYAAKLNDQLPAGVSVGLFSDLSVYVRTRLNTVKSSGVIGLLLVLASLYLFLNFRVALITAMGIPVSFLFAIIMIHYFGYTINMVSLFAFLIALGMIVDDAIIVTENVYRHMEAGRPAYEAARIGTSEVFWPVIASTATTIAAFLPMYAIGGTLGTFIAVIPAVVSFALLGSLLEAFGVLPSHAAELLRPTKKRDSRIDWGKWLRRYTDFLRWSVVNRFLVAVITICLLVLAGFYAKTRLPYEVFGKVDIGQFFINAEAPSTYSVEETSKLAAKMEAIIRQTLSDDELDTLLTNVGVTFIDFNRVKFASNQIQLVIDLQKQRPQGFIEKWVSPVTDLSFSWEGTRTRSASVIIDEIRNALTKVSGVQRLSVLRPQGGPAGADIEVGVQGKDINVLREEAEKITAYLKELEGVHDVQLDLEEGKQEYRYTLNDRGRQLGLTQSDLSEAVRTGFLGLEVVYVTWNEKRIPVRVIYPEALRRESASLTDLRITLPNNRVVLLADVAEVSSGRSLNAVYRRDNQRLATVTAEVDTGKLTAIEATDLITKSFADLPQRRPGYSLIFLGEKKEATDSIADMFRAGIIALAIIYFILTALFKSLLDPLVVMFAIPFGIIGVVFGHMLFGFNLQFLSLVGFLALSGIVVNDSLILVDFAKRMRNEGWDRIEAVIEAGRVRARPILLTSITTFLGISPLIFFATGQTAFLSPMAVSLGFGLLFATILILVALPCFYLIADDMRFALCNRVRVMMGKEAMSKESSPICMLNPRQGRDA